MIVVRKSGDANLLLADSLCTYCSRSALMFSNVSFLRLRILTQLQQTKVKLQTIKATVTQLKKSVCKRPVINAAKADADSLGDLLHNFLDFKNMIAGPSKQSPPF